MQSHGQTWWHSVQPMQRGRSIVQTWNTFSWRWPGMTLMQSTGQTVMHASHPVHMSSSSKARTFGSFFFAIRVLYKNEPDRLYIGRPPGQEQAFAPVVGQLGRAASVS